MPPIKASALGPRRVTQHNWNVSTAVFSSRRLSSPSRMISQGRPPTPPGDERDVEIGRREEGNGRGNGERVRQRGLKLAHYKGGTVFLSCAGAAGRSRTVNGQNSFPGFFLSCLNFRGSSMGRLHEALRFCKSGSCLWNPFHVEVNPSGWQIGHVDSFICTFGLLTVQRCRDCVERGCDVLCCILQIIVLAKYSSTS